MGDLAAAGVLVKAGTASDWAANCAPDLAVVGVALPSDPATEGDAALTVTLMQAFMATGLKPLALADEARA